MAIFESTLEVYWGRLQNAMVNFQYIEEGIRMYLGISYGIISRKLESQIPFQFSYKDNKNDSLRTLLEKFRKFNSNKELMEKIRSLLKERNYIAHRAYVMTSEEHKDETYLSLEIEKIEKIVDESNECFTELYQEIEKITEIHKNLK